MDLIWMVVAPFLPIVGVLLAALALGLFVVWCFVGGALWAVRAGRDDGAVFDDDPAWFAETPADTHVS